MISSQRHDSMFQLMTKIAEGLQPEKPKCIMDTTMNQESVARKQKTTRSFKRVPLGSDTYEIHLSFGTIRVRVFTYAINDKEEGVNIMTLVKRTKNHRIVATFLPAFSKFPMLEVSFSRILNTFSAHFQCLNLRPDWSPIFEFARLGDIQSVRRLIREGQASPNDVNPDGWTLLHVSS